MLFPPALKGTLRKTLPCTGGPGGGRSDTLPGSARDRATPRGWQRHPQEVALSTQQPLRGPRCISDAAHPTVTSPPSPGASRLGGGLLGSPGQEASILHSPSSPTHSFVHSGHSERKRPPWDLADSLKTRPELKWAICLISARLFQGRKFSENVLLGVEVRPLAAFLRITPLPSRAPPLSPQHPPAPPHPPPHREGLGPVTRLQGRAPDGSQAGRLESLHTSPTSLRRRSSVGSRPKGRPQRGAGADACLWPVLLSAPEGVWAWGAVD